MHGLYGYYNESDYGHIKTIWDINNLKNYLNSAEKDIKTIQEFIKEYTEQAQKILLIKNKRIIELERRINYEKRIFYHVRIVNIIYYKNEQKKRISEKNIDFEGKERIEAINYIRKLVREYNYPVVIVGKWTDRTKPKNLGMFENKN